MGVFDAGGADNLDFSDHTYPQLRAAVYGVSEEAIRVAGNEWADLKRRLNERVGALHVTVARLQPQWDSPAGRQVLDTIRTQRDWMAELARVAGINETRMDEVQAARVAAVRAMRILDAQPAGAVPPGTRPRPAPSPGPAPGSGGWVDPATLDWRQPRAAEIANYLYRQLAVAAASMAAPPRSPEIAAGSPDRTGEAGAPGSHYRGADSGPGGRSDPRGATSPAPNVAGPGAPGAPGSPVGGRSSRSRGPAARVELPEQPAAASGNGVGGRGRSGRFAATGPAVRRTGGVARGGVLGGQPPGSGTADAVAPPPGKVLGGTLRPLPDTPSRPAIEEPPPGGFPGIAGNSHLPDRPGRAKPGYERAEPDTFVDARPANAVGGQLPTPESGTRVSRLPGTVGHQKYRPAAQNDPDRSAGEDRSSPEGFPDRLETFTRQDGVTFEIRGTSRGT